MKRIALQRQSSSAFLCAKGYTLIELVTVLILVTIISSAVVPKFLNIANFRAITFTDEVKNTIRYAQKVAIGTGCDVQIAASASAVTLTMRASCSTGNFTQAIADPGMGGTSYSVAIPTGSTVTAASFPVYFDSLGRVKLVSDDSVSNVTVSVDGFAIQIVGETGFTYEL